LVDQGHGIRHGVLVAAGAGDRQGRPLNVQAQGAEVGGQVGGAVGILPEGETAAAIAANLEVPEVVVFGGLSRAAGKEDLGAVGERAAQAVGRQRADLAGIGAAGLGGGDRLLLAIVCLKPP
jgi:hypothetical protein